MVTRNRKNKRIVRRLISIVSVAAMVFSVSTSAAAQSAASDEASLMTASSGEAALETMMALDQKAPAGLARAKNPYGYDEGVPFTLSVGHELLYYGGWDGNSERKILNGSSIDALETFVDAPNKNGAGTSIPMPGGTWNWIETVSFNSDPQSAKKDKLLFVGVNGFDRRVYAWVTDYNAGTMSNTLDLGDMTWINKDYDQYSSTSLLEAVSGDFDGDGKDTLLVYAPLTLKSTSDTGCVLYELSYDGTNLTKAGKANRLLMDQYMTDQSNAVYTDTTCEMTARNKLAVSMQVGDFNGDNRDDLAVLSYSHYRAARGNTAYYSPQLKLCYGKADFESTVGRSADETFTVASLSDSTLTFPVAVSLAAGDFNGDGCDDLYAVGVKAKATAGDTITTPEVSGGTWYLHRFNGTLSSAMSNAGYTTIGANAWFEDGFYADDRCYGETLAAGVAMSGSAAPEVLFIAGSIYDVSSGVPIHKLTGSYFTSGDQGLGGVTATNTYMQSVQVGNFDNNGAGREQVAFIVGMKETGADDYWFEAGMACGTDFADTSYEDGSTCYGAAKNYYCTDLDAAEYIHKNKGDDYDEGLNCLFVSLDYDDDSVQAKYRGVNYIYTDPVVNVVLQAAPYFGDISGSGLNTTGYTLQTEYADADSAINNLEGTVGFAASGSIPFAETTSASIGLQGGFSAVHTTSHITSYSETFEAGGYDVVVTSRTPMLIYQYDILTNGQWTGKTQMEFAIPEGPVYQLMQVEQYNEFVQAYTKMMTEAGADGYHELKPIDAVANYLHENEGNPYAYNQNGWADREIEATQVNKGNGYALGTTGGRTVVSLSEGTADEESFTAELGFYVQMSVLFGPKSIANYGIELGGNYAHGWGISTTTTNTSASSFAVQDLDGDALIAGGLDEDRLAQYGFTWTCGTWKRDLGMINGDGESVKTLFLGYALSDIASPPAQEIITEAEVTFADTVRDNQGKEIGTVSAQVQGIPVSSGAIVSEPVTFTAKAADGYVLTSWTVTTDGKTEVYETNDETEFVAELNGHRIDVKATFALQSTVLETVHLTPPTEGGKLRAYTADGTELIPDENGDVTVTYNTAVTFTAEPLTGYVVSAWTEDAVGQSASSFTVNVTHDMTVGVVFKAPVKYAVHYTEIDELGNTITTTPNVKSGGTVAAGTEVTFQATALSGLYIRKWTVTKGGVATDYAVDGNRSTATLTVTVDAGTTVEVDYKLGGVIMGATPSRPTTAPAAPSRPTTVPSSPQTGDTSCAELVCLMAVLSLGVVFTVLKKKAKTHF